MAKFRPKKVHRPMDEEWFNEPHLPHEEWLGSDRPRKSGETRRVEWRPPYGGESHVGYWAIHVPNGEDGPFWVLHHQGVYRGQKHEEDDRFGVITTPDYRREPDGSPIVAVGPGYLNPDMKGTRSTSILGHWPDLDAVKAVAQEHFDRNYGSARESDLEIPDDMRLPPEHDFDSYDYGDIFGENR